LTPALLPPHLFDAIDFDGITFRADDEDVATP
jgi:hypothetical protein